MAHAYYKATILEHDYHWTTYTVWLEATSKIQAVLQAGVKAGQEKSRREFLRMKVESALYPDAMLEPEIKLEVISLEEYWANRDKVEVKE